MSHEAAIVARTSDPAILATTLEQLRAAGWSVLAGPLMGTERTAFLLDDLSAADDAPRAAAVVECAPGTVDAVLLGIAPWPADPDDLDRLVTACVNHARAVGRFGLVVPTDPAAGLTYRIEV
jgi:hypothetical protein